MAYAQSVRSMWNVTVATGAQLQFLFFTLLLFSLLGPFANIYALHFVRHIVWIYLLAFVVVVAILFARVMIIVAGVRVHIAPAVVWVCFLLLLSLSLPLWVLYARRVHMACHWMGHCSLSQRFATDSNFDALKTKWPLYLLLSLVVKLFTKSTLKAINSLNNEFVSLFVWLLSWNMFYPQGQRTLAHLSNLYI